MTKESLISHDDHWEAPDEAKDARYRGLMKAEREPPTPPKKNTMTAVPHLLHHFQLDTV